MMLRRLLRRAIIAAVIGLPAASAASQSPETPPPPGEGKIVENRSLGCRLRLPPDGEAVVAGGDELQIIRLVEKDADPPAWEMVVRAMRMPAGDGAFGQAPDSSPAGMMRVFLENAREANELLEVEVETPETQVSGLPAASATAVFEHVSGRTARFDWWFVKTGPERFVFVQCLGDRDRWPAPIFKAVMDSLELRTETDLAIDNLTVVDAGRAIVSRFEAGALRAVAARLAGDGIFYRLHAFDADGREMELGYVRLSAMESDEAAVGRRDPTAGDPDPDADLGLLVRLQSHSLPRRAGGPAVDADVRAWVAWDRESERWVFQSTARDPKTEATRSDSLIGLRPRPTPRSPRRWLEVISQGRETFERANLRVDVPQELDTFLSEAERLVLPMLLALDETPAADFAVYAWYEEGETITRRLESWRPDPAGGGVLVSRPASDARPATNTVDAGGLVTRREVPIDGTAGAVLWSLVDPTELRTLYERKGIEP